jgi:hypothetical protein
LFGKPGSTSFFAKKEAKKLLFFGGSGDFGVKACFWQRFSAFFRRRRAFLVS